MKMFFTLVIGVCSIVLNAQLQYNIGVDTTSIKNKEYLNYLERYMSEMAFDSEVSPQEFFDSTDVNRFVEPDYIMKLIGERRLYQQMDRTVLSVRDFEDYTRIQVMFSYESDNYPFQVFGIGNYYMQREGDRIWMRVPAAVLTEDWHTATVRNVRYHFPSYHQFNRVKAIELRKKIEQLEADWELDPIDIEYYFADTPDEIEALKGFEYNFYLAKNTPVGGFAFIDEGYTFSSGWGEAYFHEVVHIYLNRIYPDAVLQEGIAVYYGGSMGQDAEWHYSRLLDYLRAHPEVSPTSSEFYYMDEKTNPQTTLASAICSYIYMNDGLTGLKRAMEYESYSELYLEEFELEAEEEYDAFVVRVLTELTES